MKKALLSISTHLMQEYLPEREYDSFHTYPSN